MFETLVCQTLDIGFGRYPRVRLLGTSLHLQRRPLDHPLSDDTHRTSRRGHFTLTRLRGFTFPFHSRAHSQSSHPADDPFDHTGVRRNRSRVSDVGPSTVGTTDSRQSGTDLMFMVDPGRGSTPPVPPCPITRSGSVLSDEIGLGSFPGSGCHPSGNLRTRVSPTRTVEADVGG